MVFSVVWFYYPLWQTIKKNGECWFEGLWGLLGRWLTWDNLFLALRFWFWGWSLLLLPTFVTAWLSSTRSQFGSLCTPFSPWWTHLCMWLPVFPTWWNGSKPHFSAFQTYFYSSFGWELRSGAPEIRVDLDLSLNTVSWTYLIFVVGTCSRANCLCHDAMN